MEQCTITWLGHSCFQVALEGHVVLFDPYEDNYVPGLAPLRATAHEVYCSHDHGDHNARDLISLLPDDGKRPFQLTEMEVDHDDQKGALRGKTTIRVLQSRELRIAHLGDLGTELGPRQLAELGHLDVLMIPVGGYYTIDAAQARALVAQLRPKVVIPMHYRGASFGFPVIAPVDDFLTLDGDCVWYPGNALTVTRATKPHVAVLTYKGGD